MSDALQLRSTELVVIFEAVNAWVKVGAVVSAELFTSVVVVNGVVVVVVCPEIEVVVVVSTGATVVVVDVVVVSSFPTKELKKEESCCDSSCILISSISANSSMKASSAPSVSKLSISLICEAIAFANAVLSWVEFSALKVS